MSANPLYDRVEHVQAARLQETSRSESEALSAVQLPDDLFCESIIALMRSWTFA
jgi:hypothetical protein